MACQACGYQAEDPIIQDVAGGQRDLAWLGFWFMR
jgi:hypothetical protein